MEFDALFKKHYPKIKEHLKVAEASIGKTDKAKEGIKALKAAQSIAEKHGLPFRTRACVFSPTLILDMENSFIPEAFYEHVEESDYDPKFVKSVIKKTSVPKLSLRINDPEYMPETIEYADQRTFRAEDGTGKTYDF